MLTYQKLALLRNSSLFSCARQDVQMNVRFKRASDSLAIRSSKSVSSTMTHSKLRFQSLIVMKLFETHKTSADDFADNFADDSADSALDLQIIIQRVPIF